MTRLTLPACLVAIATLGSTSLSSQDAPAVPVGAHVRVWAPDPRLGRLVRSGATGVVMVTERDGDTVTVLNSSIRQLDVDRRRSHWKAGLLIGGVTGAMFAAALPLDYRFSGEPVPELRLAIAGAGFLGGALVGGVVGSAITTERWETIPWPPARLLVAPSEIGVGLGVSLSF